MKYITRTFLTGLVTLLPVAATVYLLVWLIVGIESALAEGMRAILPDGFYWPGVGVVLVVLLIFVVGLFMRTWVAQKLFAWGESILYRMPVVRTVYGPLRDFFMFLTEPKEKGLQQVVTVQLADSEIRLLGFLTRNNLDSLSLGMDGADHVAVYLPFSYQIGGYTLLVPRTAVTRVDMSLEDAMRFTLTAGLSSKVHAGRG